MPKEESMIHFKEKTNEATLTELESRSIGISILPCVRQYMHVHFL